MCALQQNVIVNFHCTAETGAAKYLFTVCCFHLFKPFSGVKTVADLG